MWDSSTHGLQITIWRDLVIFNLTGKFCYICFICLVIYDSFPIQKLVELTSQ